LDSENGNELAMAICYGNGEGIEKSIYQKAAENGYYCTQNNLGCLYEKGERTERNLEKAFYWFQKAAENNEFAMNNLAIS